MCVFSYGMGMGYGMYRLVFLNLLFKQLLKLKKVKEKLKLLIFIDFFVHNNCLNSILFKLINAVFLDHGAWVTECTGNFT